MKHSILILAVLFLIGSCGGGSSCNNDEDGLITENVTVGYCISPAISPPFNSPCCKYTIKTESSSEIFYLNNEYYLDKLLPHNNDIWKIKMTYRIVKKFKPGKYDKNCYLRNAKEIIVIIEIICAEIIHQK